jgi:hypothetical protein
MGLALTGVAVDAATDVLTGVTNDVSDAVNDAIKDTTLAQVEEVNQTIRSVSSHSLMARRVTDFEEGKAAIHAMKDSLEAIVASLSGATLQPPIVIFIDELDRCRPTYAVKLLEEIKHLFDVPGLVFIFAMNGDQLAHSVTSAYGVGFDGRAYIRRFIDREYQLAEPALEPLLEKLCQNAGITEQRLRFPLITRPGIGRINTTMASIIAEYMRQYSLSARDAYELVDTLQTSLALTSNGVRLEGAYLLPLLIAKLKGQPSGSLPQLKKATSWRYYQALDAFHRETVEFTFEEMAAQFASAAAMPHQAIADAYHSERPSFAIQAIGNSRDWNADPLPLWDVAQYPKLIAAVARFGNPAATTTEAREAPQARWLN